MKLILSNPRGFCAGVDRAIEIVEKALEHFGAPIYVRHEVVHNRYVVDSLRARGAIFVDELHEIPSQSIVIFSAHGVSQQVRKEAAEREFTVFDATCPLVTKVHMEVARYARDEIDCILIGHKGHIEVEGTLGQYLTQSSHIYLVQNVAEAQAIAINQPDNIAYVTQTTLSVDETRSIIEILRQRFPAIKGPRKDDICYATQNRQDAVRELASKVDMMLVVGSVTSSNSNRLRELSEQLGTPAYLIDEVSQIESAWLEKASTIGITAGASAPEVLVQSLVQHLQKLFPDAELDDIEGKPENMVFSLPKNLRQVLKLATESPALADI